MKKKSTLTVHPLRRYPLPRYPSHADPNPLDHPASLPYPFSQRLLDWALATGLVAGASASAAAQTPAAPAGSEPLRNPFPLENLGLPYTPISFGTGLPDRLEEKDVRATIEKGFAAEGISLQKQHLWKGETGEMYLDGYHEGSRLGYVILSYRRHGKGLAERWDEERDKPAPSESLTSAIERGIASDYEAALKNNFRSGEYWLRQLPDDTAPERRAQYEALCEQGKKGEPMSKRAFANFYLESHCLAGRADPVAALVQKIVSTSDPTDHADALEKLFRLDKAKVLFHQVTSPELVGTMDTLTHLAFDWAENEGGAIQQEQLYSLRYLAGVVRETPRLSNRDRLTPLLQRAAKRLYERRDWAAAQAALAEYHAEKVDMVEIREMVGDAQQGQHYIIPISYHEKQTVVREKYSRQSPPPEVVSDPEKRKQWYREEHEKAEANALAETMQRLEADVRAYIRWAKAQGRH